MPDIKYPFPPAVFNLRKKVAIKILLKSVTYAFAIFGILFILLLLAVLGLIRTSVPEAVVPDSAVLTIDLDMPYRELKQDTLLSEIVPSGGLSFYELQMALVQAGQDDRIKAIAARINTSALGMEQMQELHKIIFGFRSLNKPTYIYSSGMGGLGNGTAEYYMASAFSTITMQPNSDIGLVGVSAEIPFYRNVLDKVGIEPEFFGRYEYKSAMASFTDKKISSAFRDNMNNVLANLNVSLIKNAMQTRFAKPTKDDFLHLVDKAPFSAEYAKSIGLIDELAFEGEWQDNILKKHDAKFISVQNYASQIGLINRGKKLVLLILEGNITENSGVSPTMASEINSREVIDIVREIKKDKQVKGVLVRLNSPGGSYAASAEIWNALERLKKDKNIPIVVSMGDYAASGGYFIALAGDSILAGETTLTGSIGVVGGKFALQGLWKKLNVDWANLKLSENAGMMSPNFKLNKSQKAALNNALDRTYKDFTLKVSEARKIPLKKLDKLARGRVFTGREAVENGLIDAIGGLNEAFAALMQKSGIAPDEKFALQVYPKPKSLQEKIGELLNAYPLVSIKLTAEKLGLDVEALNVLQRMQYDAVMPPMIIDK